MHSHPNSIQYFSFSNSFSNGDSPLDEADYVKFKVCCLHLGRLSRYGAGQQNTTHTILDYIYGNETTSSISWGYPQLLESVTN